MKLRVEELWWSGGTVVKLDGCFLLDYSSETHFCRGKGGKF